MKNICNQDNNKSKEYINNFNNYSNSPYDLNVDWNVITYNDNDYNVSWDEVEYDFNNNSKPQ